MSVEIGGLRVPVTVQVVPRATTELILATP